MSSRLWPLSSLQEPPNEIIPHEQSPMLKRATIIHNCVLQKARKALSPPLAWVTAVRHVSSDERRRVSLCRIWLTLSDSSVPGQFRHTDIKHIKCLSQHFTWHCSSALICYPWRAGFCRWDQDCSEWRVKRSCNETHKNKTNKQTTQKITTSSLKMKLSTPSPTAPHSFFVFVFCFWEVKYNSAHKDKPGDKAELGKHSRNQLLYVFVKFDRPHADKIKRTLNSGDTYSCLTK